MNDKGYGQWHGIRVFGRLHSTRRAGGRRSNEQLNRRLEDGETGVEVSAWLNGLPECQKLLAEKFGGRPINEGK